ncbi:MAG: hypothetical protein R2731_15845 [Nocardioides sp.]
MLVSLRRGLRSQPVVVDARTLAVTAVPAGGLPAGFLPDGRVAAVARSGPDGAPEIAVAVAQPGAAVTAVPVPLRPSVPWSRHAPAGVATRADGRAAGVDGAGAGTAHVRWFDPATGAEVRRVDLPWTRSARSGGGVRPRCSRPSRATGTRSASRH